MKRKSKSGQFALYKGREYQGYRNNRDDAVLFSKNPIDFIRGFRKIDSGRYSKLVSLQDIEKAYVYRRTAIYKGCSFPASYTVGGMVLLLHMKDEGLQEALDLGFQWVERSVFEKVVHPDEVDEIVEVQDPIWGFKGIKKEKQTEEVLVGGEELKYGSCAVHQGREYKASCFDEQINLYSKNPIVLRYGFTEKRPGVYVKTVPTYEVEDAYDILYQAVYTGRLFHANETGDRNINLIHSGFEGLDEALMLGFEMVEPGICSKVVSPDEIERLILIKYPIWGFE